jgi:hypothetical protein
VPPMPRSVRTSAVAFLRRSDSSGFKTRRRSRPRMSRLESGLGRRAEAGTIDAKVYRGRRERLKRRRRARLHARCAARGAKAINRSAGRTIHRRDP